MFEYQIMSLKNYKLNPNRVEIVTERTTIANIPRQTLEEITEKTNPNITSVRSYFETYLENSIYTTIKVNKKDIKFYLSFERYATYISESTLKKSDIKPTLAYDYEKQEQLYSLEYIGIARTTFGNCTFDLLQNSTQTISINNISFFISKKKVLETPLIKKAKCLSDNNEEIGFNIYKGNKISAVIVEQDDPFEDLYTSQNDDDYDEDDYEYGDYPNKDDKNKKQKGERYINQNNGYEVEQNSNLINQLKTHKLINSYVFTIKYDTTKEKGEIIIGDLPHEYDPRHYSEKYFVYSSIAFNKDTPAWRIIFDNIKYGDEKLISSNLAEISINFGFISAPSSYKGFFDTSFFFKTRIC